MALTKGTIDKGITRLPNGSVSIYITGSDGKPIRRRFGPITDKAAKDQRGKMQIEAAEGKIIKKIPRAATVLFKSLIDANLEHAKAYTRSWDTIESYGKTLDDWFGARDAATITKEEIDAKIRENIGDQGRKWSLTTGNQYRALLVKIYALAVDAGKLVSNPALKAHRYKLNNSRTRELLPAEETALRAAIAKDYPSKMPELDIALHTGMRRSSMYGISTPGRVPLPPLQWADVNFDFRVLTVRQSKAGRSYTVPLNKVALAALKTLQERSEDGKGSVCRKASGLEVRSCRKWFENCLATAKIENFVWHDLRHTFATRLRRNGVSIENIARLLDHGIPALRMTLRYAHGDMSALHAAVATLETQIQTETQTETVNKTDNRRIAAFPSAKAV